ncbi:hypothetical protein K3495_g2895 [Podosphaera aphanis]|nr:hypothetical protein K3495_g2895 [Podosphaera aphanis]
MLSAFTARPIIELKPRDKFKIDSILAYGDRILVGLSTGSLRIYRVNELSSHVENNSNTLKLGENPKLSAPPQQVYLLREVEKFSTKTIEQLAIIKESNILISLSNSYVSIYDFQSYTLLEQLNKTKGATTFATTSNIVKDPDTGIPEIVSRLAVCVKRKLLLWTWHESELEQEIREITLTEPIRTLKWASATRIICGMNSGYVIIDVVTQKIEDIVGPGAIGSVSAISGGRFGGVGSASMGYIGLGAYIPKPLATKLADEQILLVKDITSLFVTCEGKSLDKKQIPWPQAPEAIGYSYPYILALQSPTHGVLEVRNPDTLSLLQSISLPNAKQLHFLPPTVSLAHAGKGFHVSSERSVWRMESTDYNTQIDELVQNENYDEAISILKMLEGALLDNKKERLREIKIQMAQKLFDKQKYQEAIDIFMAQDVQAPPERVIKLFPRVIAGTLTTIEENNQDIDVESDSQPGPKSGSTTDGSKETADAPRPLVINKIFRSQTKNFSDASSIHSVRLDGADSNDATSVRGKPLDPKMQGRDLQTATLALTGFLVQARNRMKAFLDTETGKIKLGDKKVPDDICDNEYRTLLSASNDEHDYELKLRETATLIDTTLFRSYTLARPQLAGALFRIPNFCDPDVVNEKLLESNRYNDLVDFFFGKKLHRSALELLKRIGKSSPDEDVPEALRGPQRTIGYLQNLSQEYIDLVLEFAEWPLVADPDLGMEIFLADTENAETLPRDKVVNFLQNIDDKLAVRYLEHIINDLGDSTLEFHNMLVAAYLKRLKLRQGEERHGTEWMQLMDALVEFLRKSSQYSLGKAFGLIPKDDFNFFEAQAVVLSNMGQHKQALEIYVFKIKDYDKAEDYCNRIHLASLNNTKPSTESYYKSSNISTSTDDNFEITSSIHLTLLSLYLTPPPPYEPNLPPALLLLANHGSRLPTSSILSLIPSSLPVASLESYFRGRIRSVNSRVSESRIVSGLHKTEVINVQSSLLLGDAPERTGAMKTFPAGIPPGFGGRSRRVVVSNDRVCRGCHKRLGNSVLAVLPDDTVVHYGCLNKVKNVIDKGNLAAYKSFIDDDGLHSSA